jgi:hypothetical protein
MGQVPYYLPRTTLICRSASHQVEGVLDLEQGNHNVFDYTRQFNTLAQYGSYHINMDVKKANLYPT